MKTCNVFHVEKSLDSFSKDASRADGLQPKCKQCANEAAKSYYLKKRDLILKKYAENKEENNKKAREYKQKNSAALRAYNKQYRLENREVLCRKQSEYAAKNKDAVRARHVAWLKANPWRGRVYKQNRAERVAASGEKLSYGLSEKLLKLQRGKCACCKKTLRKFHLDHIVPLAKGGDNADSNIQLLCPPCNLRKHAKHPVDFMQQEGFLL